MTATLVAVLLVASVASWPPPQNPNPRCRRRTRRDARVAAGGATIAEAVGAATLLAATLRGGSGSLEALEGVARHAPSAAGHDLGVVAAAQRWGLPPAAAWALVGAGWAPIAAAWGLAWSTGAAPADLIAAAATRMREREATRVEGATARAGVLLVLPLGLCFLPAFIATTIVPIVLALTGSVLAG